MCHVFRRIIWKEFRPIPNGPALLDINYEENLDRNWNLFGGDPRPGFVPFSLQYYYSFVTIYQEYKSVHWKNYT